MKPIEEKILLYRELSPEEREAVDAYVAQHPELSRLLAEVRAFEGLLKEARALAARPPGDSALAYYVATRLLERNAMPDGLREVLVRIEAALEEDPALRRKYEVFERRMRELEAGSDAVAQFERLSGYALAPPGAEDPPTVAEVVPPPVRPSSDRPSRRPARIFRLSSPPVRWAVAASIALVGLYGVLLLLGEATRSPLERSLRFDKEVSAFYGPHVRSGNMGFMTDPADSLYFRAIRTLGEARKTTLGLFPRYDADRLREAAAYLNDVIARVEPNSFLYLEAQFLLGKIYLALGDFPAAEAALKAVVKGRGGRIDEARELLRMLRSASPEQMP